MDAREPPEAPADDTRREFLANARKIAVAAPAAALLLAASSVPDKANAQVTSGGTPAGGAGAVLVFAGAAAVWHKLRQR